MIISTLIRVKSNYVVTLLITPITKSNDPSSMGFRVLGLGL